MDTGETQVASGPNHYADHEINLIVSIPHFLLYLLIVPILYSPVSAKFIECQDS